MTPESINIAIAEELGIPTKNARYIRPSDGEYVSHIPNFYGDLNACAEMEASLDKDERAYYVSELAGICGKFPECNPFNEAKFTTFATASQRCEAFLKVKGARE